MPKNIAITVNNDSFVYDPNGHVNSNSTVTFRLGADRVSAVVTLDPDCFTMPRITLTRSSTPAEVKIRPAVPNGTYGFSTPRGLEASQSKGKDGENGPLVGDVEVVPDGGQVKGRGRSVASATAAEQDLTAG